MMKFLLNKAGFVHMVKESLEIYSVSYKIPFSSTINTHLLPQNETKEKENVATIIMTFL